MKNFNEPIIYFKVFVLSWSYGGPDYTTFNHFNVFNTYDEAYQLMYALSSEAFENERQFADEYIPHYTIDKWHAVIDGEYTTIEYSIDEQELPMDKEVVCMLSLLSGKNFKVKILSDSSLMKMCNPEIPAKESSFLEFVDAEPRDSVDGIIMFPPLKDDLVSAEIVPDSGEQTNMIQFKWNS